MQVTIRAKCWDGQRRKSLSEVVKVEGLPVRKWNTHKMKSLAGYTLPLALLGTVLPNVSFAQTPEAVPALSPEVRSKILHAFDPLINMIQHLAYPVAGVMIAGGCLFIMVGNREKGMQMLQNAALGYILVQLSPMLLELLVGIGQTV